VHRIGYLERFLFRGEQMTMPVGMLSGGEQSRLLLARLMLRPAQVLVLDEPTNDLDLPTLRVLEEALTSFPGAVLLVSHDRYFVGQVATQLLAFHTHPEQQGQVSAFADLPQWEAWRPGQAPPSRAPRDPPSRSAPSPSSSRKLGYRDQRDWDTIESRIGEAEARLAALVAQTEHPDTVSDGDRLLALDVEMSTVRAEIDALYARWAELEALQR
jgi:ATP-binding cassette subfamily F protein uup